MTQTSIAAYASWGVAATQPRDTASAMKDYLSSFDPHLKGLTGNPEEVSKVLSDPERLLSLAQQYLGVERVPFDCCGSLAVAAERERVEHRQRTLRHREKRRPAGDGERHPSNAAPIITTLTPN